MEENEIIWPKNITVDKRIVKILSESTYDSFPHSLKELIVNSYDADAKNVKLTVDLKKEYISIEDDGIGMSVEDFDFYLRIAGKKRDKGIYTKSGRPIIGQFGVGFLSVFPFFLNYHIETKKKGVSEYLYADIPCYKYFTQEKNSLVDINAININGGVKNAPNQQNLNYTKITLSGFTPLAKAFFNTKNKIRVGKKSILQEDGLSILKWYLEDDLPLKFEDESFTKRFIDEYEGYPFEVYFNNEPLKRRIFGKVLMKYSEKELTAGAIKYRYFICSNEEPVSPSEATGLKIRNLNVGVGKRTTFNLGVDFGGTRSRLRWISGEIHILEGLNNAIKVSRDDFYFNQDYDQIKTEFVSLISNIVGTLESEQKVKDFLSTNKIENLNFLEKKSLSKQIEKVKSQKLQKPQVYSSVPKKKNTQKNDIEENINEFNSETFEKKYKIKNKTFILETKKWDYNKENFPACKIEGNKIIINKSYPLFGAKKHLDVFLRFNILLIMWLKEGKITESNYSKMVKESLENFSEYHK